MPRQGKVVGSSCSLPWDAERWEGLWQKVRVSCSWCATSWSAVGPDKRMVESLAPMHVRTRSASAAAAPGLQTPRLTPLRDPKPLCATVDFVREAVQGAQGASPCICCLDVHLQLLVGDMRLALR